MKVYLFYDSSDVISATDELYYGMNYRNVYAFTDDKKLAEKFKESRPKNLKMRVRKMSKPEYVHFTNKHAMREIKMIDYVTIVNGELEEISLVSTRYEYDIVQDNVTSACCTILSYFNPYLFDKKYRNALDVLRYNASYALSVSDYGQYYDAGAPNIIIDEIWVLMKLFAKYF